jgi:vacuolar-type H+-ATPase subunit F/Vma7
MARIYYIGDEATAAGYRLAGAETRVPATGETPAVFHRALADGADLVLLSAERAGELEPDELEAALLAGQPLIAIVPDVLARHAAPDLPRRVRCALGIES